MILRRMAVAAAFATTLAALPLMPAEAQFLPPCSPFPLAWPFCVLGVAVGTAAAIIAAPLQVIAPPPYYYSYYGRPFYPPPPPPGYYPPPNPPYGPR